MYNKIVVALDLSEANKQVFREALSLAKASRASLFLLHVISKEEKTSPLLSGYLSHPKSHSIHISSEILQKANKAFQKEWQEFENKGLEMLNSFAKKAIAAGVTTECIQIAGHPSSTICEYAHSSCADLIAIGKRGHSGLQEMMLGSVSNHVVHHSPCSVLLVQTPIVQESNSAKRRKNMVYIY